MQTVESVEDSSTPALHLNSFANFPILCVSQRGCVCACTLRSKGAQTAPSLLLRSVWRGFASEAAGDSRTAGTTSSAQGEERAEVLEEHPAASQVLFLLRSFLPWQVLCLVAC